MGKSTANDTKEGDKEGSDDDDDENRGEQLFFSKNTRRYDIALNKLLIPFGDNLPPGVGIIDLPGRLDFPGVREKVGDSISCRLCYVLIFSIRS